MKETSDWKEDTSTPLLVNELGTSETNIGSPGDLPQVDNNAPGDAVGDLCCRTDDSSGDEQPDAVNEVDFKVSTLISAFANCGIIHNLCWLHKFIGAIPVLQITTLLARCGRSLMTSSLLQCFIRFKDYPNCGRFIAQSLDPDGGILPAQVSNKLKQLVLRIKMLVVFLKTANCILS